MIDVNIGGCLMILFVHTIATVGALQGLERAKDHGLHSDNWLQQRSREQGLRFRSNRTGQHSESERMHEQLL